MGRRNGSPIFRNLCNMHRDAHNRGNNNAIEQSSLHTAHHEHAAKQNREYAQQTLRGKVAKLHKSGFAGYNNMRIF